MTSSTERKRHERAMKAAGKVYVAFWTDEVDLAIKIEAARTIDPNLADDPKAISEATRRLIEGLGVGVVRDITR